MHRESDRWSAFVIKFLLDSARSTGLVPARSTGLVQIGALFLFYFLHCAASCQSGHRAHKPPCLSPCPHVPVSPPARAAVHTPVHPPRTHTHTPPLSMRSYVAPLCPCAHSCPHHNCSTTSASAGRPRSVPLGSSPRSRRYGAKHPQNTRPTTGSLT